MFGSRIFDLIIGAIRHHFRSYLEAEPEVQAEIALYQSTRFPKGTLVEYTSRISNKLREMESGFKKLLPPKLNGFIIATGQVALNRLDQTDALEEQKILGDRAKLEHHVNRGHAHPNSHAQAYPMEAEITTSSESNHHHNQKTSSDTESDQLDWNPERIDDDGHPLVDENGSTLVPVPREGPLEEDEASSLTAWAQGYREVLKICVIRSRDVATVNPSQAVTRKLCAKLCSTRNHRDETETSALHSETKREISAQNVSLEPS